jgi:myo-inositol 2-dehydrogenase/D-chiro-inositol 1-dehydrogenase
MKKELNIGVVGTGAIGRAHIERINTKLQGGRVIAVSDVNAEFGEKVAETFGCAFYKNGGDLINAKEVDAVIITTTDEYHEQYTTEAIKAGKYVFCEKPLAVTQEGCARIVKAEMSGGKQLVQVGFMRRYDTGYRQLKKILDERTYGEPLMLHCAHRNFDAPSYYKTAMAVENTMIHEIDVLRWLLNDDYAEVEVVFPRKTKHVIEGQRDPQIMYLTTNSGVRIDVEAFIFSHYGYDIKCEICCEEGIINLPEPANVEIRTGASRVKPICRDWSERFPEAYNIEIQAWINATIEGRVDGPGSWDGYVGAITASAASRARDTQTKVKIEMEQCPAFYKGSK